MNSLPNDILRYIALRLDPKSLYVYLLMSRKILTANTKQVPALQRLHSKLDTKEDIPCYLGGYEHHINIDMTKYFYMLPNGCRSAKQYSFGHNLLERVIIEYLYQGDTRTYIIVWTRLHGGWNVKVITDVRYTQVEYTVHDK